MFAFFYAKQHTAQNVNEVLQVEVYYNVETLLLYLLHVFIVRGAARPLSLMTHLSDIKFYK